MSGNRSESGTAMVKSNDMSVPADQVDNFLKKLREYAEACARSKADANSALDQCSQWKAEACAAVEKSKAEVKRCQELRDFCAEERRNMAECSLTVVKEMRVMDDKTKKHDVDMNENRRDVGNLVDQATDICNDCKRAASRVDIKERFVQSYADVAKSTETEIKHQYTRTIYAASISRQIAFSSLKAMEGTLNMLHAVHSLSQRSQEKVSSTAMVDNEVPDSSDKTSAEKLEGDIATALESVRALQLDVHNLERTVRVLDQISMLNETVTAACTDPAAFTQGVESLEYKRKQIELLVRQAMPFDRTTYVTVANYEAFILEQVSRRLQSTTLNGSALLEGVIQSLKHDGVTAPGMLPKVISDLDGKKRAAPQ